MVTNNKCKLILVAGARPNFMKIAPIVRELRARSIEQGSEHIEWKIVHTGQHYDYGMSQAFFDDLEIPKPDYFLEAGSGKDRGRRTEDGRQMKEARGLEVMRSRLPGL